MYIFEGNPDSTCSYLPEISERYGHDDRQLEGCQLDIIIISLDLPRDLEALLHLVDGKGASYIGVLGSVVQIVEEHVDIAWLRRRSVQEGIASSVRQLSLVGGDGSHLLNPHVSGSQEEFAQ